MTDRYTPYSISATSEIPSYVFSDDREFIANCAFKLPSRFRSKALTRYYKIAKVNGRTPANQFFSRISDLSSQANCMAGIISDGDIVIKAKQISQKLFIAFPLHGYQAALNIAHIYLRAALLPDIVKLETEDRVAKRLVDESWWRRALRSQRKQAIESIARDVNLVNRYAGLYVTDESIKLRESQKARNRTMLEECVAVNELGQEYTLAELSELSVSNPTIRRSELMVRLSGFETWAKKSAHIGELWTVTCPSRMHASHSKSGNMNIKYDGTTPKQAQAYLAKIWTRVRAKFQREGISVYGMRVVEPNHDGTPHWHFAVFMEERHRYRAREIYRSYALAVDGDEKGAKERRFDTKAVDWKKGTATGYLAKYISKNIDGFGVGDDLYGNDATSSAKRVETWASTWNIRQFQQVGGPPVTVWRQLRKLNASQTDETIEPVRKAADDSDWCQFLELMETAPVKIERIYSEKLNRYDEPAGDLILGVSLQGVTYVTRLHEWTIEHRPSEEHFCKEIKPYENFDLMSQFSNQTQRAERVLEFCQ
jgi:hypothetical protein